MGVCKCNQLIDIVLPKWLCLLYPQFYCRIALVNIFMLEIRKVKILFVRSDLAIYGLYMRLRSLYLGLAFSMKNTPHFWKDKALQFCLLSVHTIVLSLLMVPLLVQTAGPPSPMESLITEALILSLMWGNHSNMPPPFLYLPKCMALRLRLPSPRERVTVQTLTHSSYLRDVSFSCGYYLEVMMESCFLGTRLGKQRTPHSCFFLSEAIPPFVLLY